MTLAPSDLDLPAKFHSFRQGQEESALELASDSRRFSLLAAPTGSGKSLIYAAVSRLLAARTLILVGTKGLQSQLMEDFAEMGMRDVRGQSNYRCVALEGGLSDYGRPGAGCDEGPCHVGVYCNLKHDGGCLYYDAQAAAKQADIVVTNYAYWLTLGRHSDPDAIGKFDLLVMDEAHTAPDWLADFCAVELDRHEIKSLLGLSLPPINEGVNVWAEWAQGAVRIARAAYDSERAKLVDRVQRQRTTKKLLRLSEITRGLSEMARAYRWKQAESPNRDARMPGTQTDWVAESTDKGARFSPVWAHAYAEPYLYRSIPRVLLVSATLSPVVGRYLGIPSKHSHYYEAGSGFNPDRRPFIYVPTTKVDRKMVEGQYRIWVNRIDQIIDGRLDRKGIIHTRSYQRAKQIYQRSRHKDIMMIHTPRTTREVIMKFRKADSPCVLVSPSVEEGFDFPHDLCRYQIIAKVPFIDGRPPLTRARKQSDKKYMDYVTALALVQMVGRGMRAADDFCETFIIDDHWGWFRRAAKRQFPHWFMRSWRESRAIPGPPPLGATFPTDREHRGGVTLRKGTKTGPGVRTRPVGVS